MPPRSRCNAWFGGHPCALSVIPTAGFASVGGIVEINFLAVKDRGAVKKQIVACDLPSTMAYGPPAVRAGDPLRFTTQLLAHDAKRLHYFLRPLTRTSD